MMLLLLPVYLDWLQSLSFPLLQKGGNGDRLPYAYTASASFHIPPEVIGKTQPIPVISQNALMCEW